MASLNWYVQRAAAMGPRELLWRTRNAVRDRADRLLLLLLRRRRLTWSPDDGSLVGRGVGIAGWCNGGEVPVEEYPAHWRQRLLDQAEEICENRLSFFDRDGVHLGEPIDWNRDHKAGIACPVSFAAKIDDRDFAEVGDCKFVWEPSRHHPWVVLGRAYRLTGEKRFAEAAARHAMAKSAGTRRADDQLGDRLRIAASGRGVRRASRRPAGRGDDRLSVAFDCGPLGMGSLAAHGHADALSFTLRAFGKHVLVDPGTYDYFSYPRWRRYFRGTRAHNTVVIDGQDQSVQRGLFLWGRRAEATLTHWQPSPVGGGVVAGSHDGYMRLPEPVTHSRRISLDATTRNLTVIDTLDGDG